MFTLNHPDCKFHDMVLTISLSAGFLRGGASKCGLNGINERQGGEKSLSAYGSSEVKTMINC